ncbi:cipC protein [Mycena rosella]|uniref:CipC protein n=1 Tax=Mycena rosella TaxID=1033263 RepID=A0AAD7GXX7_MYCRO|nr:cipC protein [Mycena rosella]
MGFFGSDSSEADAYNQISSGKVHKADMSHELLAGAASFAAAHEYEKHCEANGKPQSHAEAKELLAAFAGTFIDREVESHGLDFIDKEKAKHDAHKNASEAIASDY